jgi:hypothetical protein
MESTKKARLINCLQTILELESQLRSLRDADSLLGELSALRSFVQDLRIEQTDIHETDIQHIELATKVFLQELETHFQYVNRKPCFHGLLQ